MSIEQETKEIIELMKEWKNEIKGISNDYTEAIKTLNEAKGTFEKKWWVFHNKKILWVIIAIIIIVVLIVCGQFFDTVEYHYPVDFKVSKECQE